MKKILFFLFATLFAISVPAQNVQVLVGDPDINMMPNQVNFREGPIPGYYGYHNAAFLYTPADMQYFRGDIQSLAFQIVTPASWHANRYMKISMKEVDYEVLASTMVMNYFLNGSTVVFEQTNVSAESAGWRTFSFSEPFHYSGEKSLLVVVNGAGCDVTNAGWVNGCQVHQRTTPATNMAWIKMAAGQNINFNSEGADQSMMNRRFNTLFTITPDANLCYTPNDLNAPSASITNNSAVLQWTDCPIGMEYFIEWKAYSANWGENPAYTAMVDQGTETYTISNLLSNTLYNARIRTNCMVRNGNGDWVTINFRTDCGIITELPYFEDFDTYNTAGTAFATCWERYNDGAVSTSTPNFDPYTGHNSPPCVYFGGTDATLVSQPFIMDIKDFQVNLWVLKGSSTGTFEVGYLATPADPTTFVALETLDDVFNVWTQHSVSLSGAPEGVKQIAFRGYSYYLDDILVFEPDNFIDAEIVAITAPPTLGMNFTNEQVKAVVKNNAANPLSGFTLTLEVNDIFVVTENFEGAILPNEQVTYTFTALANISAGGAHTITVTVNAAGDVVPENNSKTITVTNQICPLLTRELLPLMENFDSFGADYNTDNFPECWQRMATTSWSPVIYPFQYFSSPNCLFMNQVSGGVSDYAIVVLPQIDPSVGMDELRLKFKLRGTDNTHPLLVGIMTNPSDPNSFELVEAVYNILQVTYEDMTVLFNQYTGTGRFIAFKVVGGPGGFGGSGTTAYIDDLVLELLPQCSEVANLAFSNVSTTSAMATWSDGTMGTPTSYTVEIRAAGTGTWTTYSTTNRSYIFTGLLEATKYEVRIFTNCGEMVSENYASGNFSTQCFSGGELLFNTPAGTINQNIPLSNFANYSYTQQIFLPGEFGEEATTIRGIAFEYSGLLPTLLKNNCKIYLSHTVLRSEFNNPVTDYIPFTTTGGAAFVEVYSGHLNMTYGWNYFYFDTPFNYDGMRNLVITVYDESGQAGGYDRWFNQHSTGNVNRTVYYYQGTFIDFRINPGVAVTAFAWNTRANTRFLVSCDAAPTCPAPNIVLQNITPSSIDANIVANGNETSWILEYKMDSETGWTSIGTVSTMPYTIDNLSPNTTYQVRARAICSGEQSDWATETVTTPQLPVVPATIPWYCDFEETFENDQWRFANFDIPTQNNWYIGTATNNGGTRSLYVSNTGGATNVFSFSIASTVWAYRDIEFPTSTNDFLLSFDVNVFGHSQAYYSEVFIGELIPVTASASFSYYGLDPVPAGLTKVGESLAGIQPWQTRSFVIPASLVSGKIQRLYFVWVNANHGMSYVSPPTALDNLSITTLTCNTPTNLAFSNLKHDCVDLTWNENGTATQWIVEYAISPFTTWIPVTVNQSELTGGVYTLSGLSGGTTYNVRVKAVCSASDISFSSNTVNFTTPCASLSIPTALEEFEAVPPNTCWTRFNGQLPAAGSPTLTPIAHNLQGYQYWSKSTLVTPHNAYTNLYYATDFKWLVTNSINLTGAPAQIEFDLFLTGYANANPPNISSGLPNKRFVVLISLDNGATWSAANTLRQWDNKGSQYVFNELTNVPLPVIIPLEDSNGNPYTGDVKIAFYAESTGIDGGADIDIHIDNFQVTVEEIEDPCMLKRADFPLIENFDSYSSEYSVDNYPECWQRFSTTGVFPMIYPFYFFSAPNCLFLNQYSGTISDYSIAILPQIDPSIGMDALRLKFKLRGTTTSQALLVGVMSDANDPNSFVLVETLYNTLTATYEDMTVLFDQYTGTGHYVAFKVMGGPGGFGGPGTSAYIDDLVLELMSPCSEVENLAFSNVSATSAMATWSDGIRGTPVSYTIEIREAGTATWLSYSTTEKSYIFTGLSEATKYEVQIWTSCEGDMVSDNYTSGIFYTKCLSGGERAFNTPAGNDNQNIPLSNFANYSYTQQIFLPNELGDEATTIRGISFEYGGLLPTTVKNNCIIYLSHTSLRSEFYNSYSDYIPFTTSGAAAFVEVYSGHLNMTPGWNTFYFDTPFEYNGLQNLVVTVFDASGQNDGSGRVFKQHNTGVNRTVYYYQGSYIDFRLNPSVAVTQFQWDTRANTIFLTDCTPDVTCPVPNVIIQNITATSIGVNIIANGTEDSWTLEYKQVSEATWTSLGAVSSMPYTIDNLTPNTAYQVRARAACSTFEADWVVHTVTTPFLPVVLATIPWICDFEDETENAQWRFANLETTPQTNWFIGSAVNNGGAQSMYISNTGGATNATIFGSAVTWTYRDIEFPASTDDFMLSFDIRVNGAENFYSAVFMGDLTPVTANVTGNLIAPGGTTRLGGSYHSINNWTNYSFVLPASEYAGKAQRLYFAWVNGAFLMGSPGLPAAIDNIAITILSCNSPANLTYSNLAPFSVDLSWTQSGDATEWIVEYQVSSASTWIPITVYQPSYTLTGLSDGATYNVRVKAVCGEDEISFPSNVITFTTPCGAATVPTALEEFFAVPPSTCWTRFSGALPATGNATLTSVAHSMSGWTVWDFSNAVTPHNARANMYVGYEKWLVSSSIDLTGTSAQLEFDLFYTSYGSANPPTIPASPQGRRFVVLISLDNGGTWNAANTLRQWDDKGSEYVFSQLTNVPQRVIIPLLDGAGNPYTGNVKIAFYAESLINEGDNDLHIDNFQVLGLNPCFYSPTITLQSVTATNATIGFTANDAGVACQYVYAESATITDPDAGTPVSTTDNPFTITGLNPATQYTVWVKAVCGAGYSNWSLPLSFTTEPLPATVPYICTFEDDDPESDLWKKAASGLWGPTMQWYRGTAAGNGGTETGTKAMFTSKDGISFANDVNYTQYAFMWRDIDFGPNVGTYNLKFDFRCEGLVYAGQVYDRIDVLLVDPFEVFNVNTLYGIQIGYTYGSADWSSEVLQISNVSGVQCLMFVGVVLYMNPNAAIDNIKIEEATCIIPYDLLITDMTSSGVTIDFTPTGADFYIASYRTTSSSTIIHETFTAPPYTISIPGGQDLDYVCAVRSVCGEDTTKFSNSLFFTLPCAPFEIPWEEGFESITAHNTLPPCMRATTLGGLVLTSVGPQPQYDLEAHTGNNFACFRYSCDDYIYTPSFDLLNETTYKFSFWYVTTGYSGWQTLQAELRDAITGELVQIIGTPLSNVLNTNWVQFSGVFTPSAAGLYTIAIYCKSTGVQGFLTIDDLALMALDFYTITATAGEGGTIDPAGEIKVNEGDSKTFTITPNTGYHILSVSVDGVPIAYSVNPELTATFTYTFENVTNNHTITATFALNCYLPVINTGDGVTVTPTTCIPHGSSVTFTITPDYCYDITQVLINGVNQGANYTIANVTGKPTIVVSTSLRKYTVTATPAQGIDPLGYITPSGTSSVDCGEDKEYFFHPIEGHRVSGVFVNGEQVPAPNYILNYTLKNIRVNTTIHVEFEKLPQYMIQFGPRAAQNAGGVVFPTKEPDAEFFIYVDTATVSCPFTIEAFDGFEIDKVYVDGAVVNVTGTSTATYEFVNVSANHTIFATFKPIMFTIIATADLNGTINPNGTIQVAWGDDQTFHAIANEGCELIDVIVNGESIGAINSYTFEDVRANGSIHAVFSKIVYPITTAVIGGNGHIIPSANPIMVVHGNSVTLTFVPDQGYTVNTVVIDNVPHPAAALAGTYTFTNVTQAHDVVVTFKKLTYTITSTVTVGGFIDPAGTIFVTHGEHSPTYVFDAYEGYYISSVLVDGVVNHEAMANGIYRFFNVTANHTILVMFARDSYTIAATATQGGSITPSGIVTVPSGTNRRFDFGPQQGFELFRVMIDGLNDEEALANGYYTFMNVLDDHSIATHFRKLTYTVTLPLPDDCTTVIPEDGSTMNIITVEYGDRFAFTVNIADPCSQSNIIVRSNGMIIVPTGGVYTINNITSDQIVTIVNAELNQYRITARAFAGGTIDPDGIYMVTHGSEESFMITPNLNFKIDKVEVNGAPVVLAGNVYTLKNIIADAIIEAHFKRDDVGIDENNPVINVFSYSNLVTIMNKDLVPVKQVEIMDVFGRVVWHGQANSEKTEITLHVAAGIYAVRIHTGDNQYLTTKVVIN